ncbi:MAG TPA: hypothetical protein VHV57_09525 [Acidimicrobiales bacterium]|jgi:hypothetical protein|nr:hypothetical protein [Acidimicrobiales bacterium]
MAKRLYKGLGEKGESLTILSLLRPPAGLNDDEELEGDLTDISQRLRDLTGDDSEMVNMYSVYPNEGGSLEFLSLELVPLRQAIERMQQLPGNQNGRRTVLSVLDPSSDGDDSEESAGGAFTHLRDALRGLFNRAGENGQPLTLLSLLSEPESKVTSSE